MSPRKARRPEIRYTSDLRYPNRGREIDEVCAENAYVHLEQMNDSEWSLIIASGDEEVCLSLGPRRRKSHVKCFFSWRSRRLPDDRFVDVPEAVPDRDGPEVREVR